VIHFVSGEYPPDIGGVGDYTSRLRAALSDLGWSSNVTSRRQVGGHWDARALMWLLRHVPATGIVHIQYQAGAFDLLGDICLVPLLLRRVRPRVRSVTTFHDVRVPYLFPRAGVLRSRALRMLAETSDAIIAADRRDLRALGRDGFRVPIGSNVPCAPPSGYQRAAFRHAIGIDDHETAVVYFGLLNASKGLDLLLNAFGLLTDAKLLVLGGDVGASDPTDRLTASRIRGRLDALGNKVIRTGWQPPQQLSAYLLAGDVALLPYQDGASARRGSLLACAEHSLPVVSTQPVGDEVAPYMLACPPNAAELAQAVRHLDLERQRAASRALAEQVSWGRIAKDHVRIYDQVLARARSA
jgi:glycosyltransferase involved in cell wall biosynthesis